MKKVIILVALFLCCCLTDPVFAQKKVRMNHSNITIKVGGTAKLKLLNKKDKVTWYSTKKKIVTVNSKGIVKARKEGVAVVIAKIRNKQYKCKVTVTPSKKQNYNSSSLKVNNEFFTQQIYNKVKKINWETASKAVTDQKGIYEVFNVLCSAQFVELPQDSQKFVGGITLLLVFEDGSTMGFSLGSNVLLINDKMYSVSNFDISILSSILDKYAK